MKIQNIELKESLDQLKELIESLEAEKKDITEKYNSYDINLKTQLNKIQAL